MLDLVRRMSSTRKGIRSVIVDQPGVQDTWKPAIDKRSAAVLKLQKAARAKMLKKMIMCWKLDQADMARVSLAAVVVLQSLPEVVEGIVGPQLGKLV